MKKILFANIICATLIMLCVTNVSAEKVNNLAEKLDELIMERQFTTEQFSQMDKEYLKDFDKWFWNDYLPPTKLLGKMNTDSDEAEYEYCLSMNRPDYSYGVLMTYLDTNKYAKQYAENEVFNYLLDDTKQYWAVLHKRGSGVAAEFRKDGSRIYDMNLEIGDTYETITITQELIDLLKDSNKIETMLLDKGEMTVTDLKLFSMQNGITFLYIKCDKNEYLIKLYGFSGYCEYIPEIAGKKLYTVSDVLRSLAVQEGRDLPSRFDLSQNISKTKRTFESEAKMLQDEGLLKGNENGLDLLKPLTRAEAVTLLVRALGLESEVGNYTDSQFSDISSDNWASPYAALAKSRGIVNGVSETEFAPDEQVTADQFATFTLRAMGERDFDYTEGIKMLVDKGIITQENAETMDFFTRGDMAKIIYEAREKGLL